MLGIDELIVVHRSSVDPTKKPVRPKMKIFAPERQKVIDEEITKLLEVDVIFEMDYLKWLANVVMVQK